MTKTAILVDGAFYLKRAKILFGEKTPEQRADELYMYCNRHIKDKDKGKEKYLYRIFFYDCPPSRKTIYNPLTQKSINLEKSPQFAWSTDFHKAVVTKRKTALRMGELLESTAGFILKAEPMKKLLRKEITVDDLTIADFSLDIAQKGVDMRIGLDIASLAQKKLVDQIILIAGDSDFVPAAKHARREGIDFILDPMWHTIKDSLNEHIDGLHSCVGKLPYNLTDPLCLLKKPKVSEENSSALNQK